MLFSACRLDAMTVDECVSDDQLQTLLNVKVSDGYDIMFGYVDYLGGLAMAVAGTAMLVVSLMGCLGAIRKNYIILEMVSYDDQHHYKKKYLYF